MGFNFRGVLVSFIAFVAVAANAQAQQKEPIAKLNRYNSISGWSVNSYWVETNKNLILIDAQLLPEDALMMAQAMKTTGKPLAGVFITHPHPDHFAGLAVLKKEFGKFPIYASISTADKMQAALKQFLSSSFSVPFGNRVEKQFVAASHILKSNQKVEIDGLSFVLDDLGPGESENNSVVYVPEKQWLFTGDATMNHSHYYVGEGRSALVLSQMDHLKENYSKAYFYTGHGEPARIAIVDQHIEYIEMLRSKVAHSITNPKNLAADKKYLTREARKEIALQILERFPTLGDFGFEPLQVVAMNLWGVESELLAEKHKSMADMSN